MRSFQLFKARLHLNKFRLQKTLQIALLSATVSACGHVAVKDKEVCVDLGVAGAHCAHTFITKRRDLTKAQWDLERVGRMSITSDDFSDTEDSLDELCRTTNLCDYETQDQIAQVKAKMAPLVSKALTAKKSK